ncbi:UNKNOWN [Stylonychia lemnae]|uniref:Uncharacterized protein n=1 Tax=Stylonychia lemnae TaxID=5949 RepID=A0A078B184_STYLE|nr:UNKNOWN [Stylonychia lemnae]|eukprot:CDW88091.1 UNKNOWN [Stylonychia lemnae]
MQVSPESQVQNQESFLHKWDSTARRYFNHFEIHKQATREGLRRVFQNILTSFRDPIQYRHRLQDIDVLTYRQLLGDISHDEVHELHQVFCPYSTGYCFTKGLKDPASLFAWRSNQLAAAWLFGAGIGVYAKFVKKYNILWLAAGFIPMWALLLYNASRQPQQLLENSYKYLLAKRAATCEHEKNQARFNENEFTKTPEFSALQQALRERNITMYELENELLNKIASGELRA